jgi:chromosome segregation and condensation protein ScpB
MSDRKIREDTLAEMLSIIRRKPGIRPREIHAIMGLDHSAPLRNTLIKRGLVRKERKGAAVHYYPV